MLRWTTVFDWIALVGALVFIWGLMLLTIGDDLPVEKRQLVRCIPNDAGTMYTCERMP